MVLDELVPAGWYRTGRYATNRVAADHGQLKRRLRPMRGLNTDIGARVITAGHAFIQNLRRGHHQLAIDEPAPLRLSLSAPTSSPRPSDRVAGHHRSHQRPPITQQCPRE